MTIPAGALHAARSLVRMISAIDSPLFLVQKEQDGGFRFIHANRALEQTSDLGRSAVNGRRPEEVLPLRVARSLAGKFEACLRDGALQFEQGARIRGRHRWWHMALTPLVAVGDTVGVILGVVSEITAMKEALFTATARAAALERRYEDLKVLTSLTAHDMRAPLGNVRSLVDLVLDGFCDLGNEKVQMIARCGEVADQALAQIDVIMAHARSLDTPGHVRVPLNLARVCEDIATLVDPVCAIRIDYPDAAIVAEAMLLQMTLRNLLDNAVRYCRGRIRIELDQDTSGGVLVFTVSDDGPGFAATAGPGGAGHGAKAGRGFGLAAVRAQLQGRGGSLIQLEPADGFATRLRFSLPGQRLAPSELVSQCATA